MDPFLIGDFCEYAKSPNEERPSNLGSIWPYCIFISKRRPKIAPHATRSLFRTRMLIDPRQAPLIETNFKLLSSASQLEPPIRTCPFTVLKQLHSTWTFVFSLRARRRENSGADDSPKFVPLHS